MFCNNNLYDRLKTCVVGQTWSPKFYDWITEPAVREPLQRIAYETQQDLDGLAAKLQSLGVEVLRPRIDVSWTDDGAKVPAPPMNPGDSMCMIDTVFVHAVTSHSPLYDQVLDTIAGQNLIVTLPEPTLCAAMHFQFEHRVVVGRNYVDDWATADKLWRSLSPKPCQRFPLPGHIDGWFSPVSPGLIVSDVDPHNQGLLKMFYKTYFPDWQVVSCQGGWQQNEWSISDWQQTTRGRWWVQGEESNTKFHDFVDRYLVDWVGNAQESVFDVNIVIVDDRNVIVRESTNQLLLESLDRHGVTIHQVPFRHATFWDGCVNCATLPLSRG